MPCNQKLEKKSNVTNVIIYMIVFHCNEGSLELYVLPNGWCLVSFFSMKTWSIWIKQANYFAYLWNSCENFSFIYLCFIVV